MKKIIDKAIFVSKDGRKTPPITLEVARYRIQLFGVNFKRGKQVSCVRDSDDFVTYTWEYEEC